jgi:hypothetical protein
VENEKITVQVNKNGSAVAINQISIGLISIEGIAFPLYSFTPSHSRLHPKFFINFVPELEPNGTSIFGINMTGYNFETYEQFNETYTLWTLRTTLYNKANVSIFVSTFSQFYFLFFILQKKTLYFIIDNLQGILSQRIHHN